MDASPAEQTRTRLSTPRLQRRVPVAGPSGKSALPHDRDLPRPRLFAGPQLQKVHAAGQAREIDLHLVSSLERILMQGPHLPPHHVVQHEAHLAPTGPPKRTVACVRVGFGNVGLSSILSVRLVMITDSVTSAPPSTSTCRRR